MSGYGPRAPAKERPNRWWIVRGDGCTMQLAAPDEQTAVRAWARLLHEMRGHALSLRWTEVTTDALEKQDGEVIAGLSKAWRVRGYVAFDVQEQSR